MEDSQMDRDRDTCAMTLRLTPEEHLALRVAARAYDVSMNEVARRALRAYFDQTRGEEIAKISAKMRRKYAAAFAKLAEQ
jgi:hypothetical protein